MAVLFLYCAFLLALGGLASVALSNAEVCDMYQNGQRNLWQNSGADEYFSSFMRDRHHGVLCKPVQPSWEKLIFAQL